MFSSTLAKKVQLSFLSTVGRVKTELKSKSFPPTPNVIPWGEKKKITVGGFTPPNQFIVLVCQSS